MPPSSTGLFDRIAALNVTALTVHKTARDTAICDSDQNYEQRINTYGNRFRASFGPRVLRLHDALTSKEGLDHQSGPSREVSAISTRLRPGHALCTPRPPLAEFIEACC